MRLFPVLLMMVLRRVVLDAVAVMVLVAVAELGVAAGGEDEQQHKK